MKPDCLPPGNLAGKNVHVQGWGLTHCFQKCSIKSLTFVLFVGQCPIWGHIVRHNRAQLRAQYPIPLFSQNKEHSNSSSIFNYFWRLSYHRTSGRLFWSSCNRNSLFRRMKIILVLSANELKSTSFASRNSPHGPLNIAM